MIAHVLTSMRKIAFDWARRYKLNHVDETSPLISSPEHCMSPLPDRRRVKGIGRVAFIANLDEITVELDAGWPIKAVYTKRVDRLGMSYAQFARYVDQIVRRNPRARPVAGSAVAAPQTSQPPPPVRVVPDAPARSIAPEGTFHAGYHAPSSFEHDAIEGPDDRKRLLGDD